MKCEERCVRGGRVFRVARRRCGGGGGVRLDVGVWFVVETGLAYPQS